LRSFKFNKKTIQLTKFTYVQYMCGFYLCYLQYLKIKGMGFKLSLCKNRIFFRLGQSHRIIYYLANNFKALFYNKLLIRLESRNLDKLKKAIFNLLKIVRKNSYKKKGLFIKGSIVKVKVSSKKSKF